MQLSEQQKEAMTTVNGQVILISCPGSGKTSTVVRRVQYMVGQGIPADQILVLTFSKAAALEMAERFYKLAGNTEMAAGGYICYHPFILLFSHCTGIPAECEKHSWSGIPMDDYSQRC